MATRWATTVGVGPDSVLPKRKVPPCGGTILALAWYELPAALTLLVRFLALPVRILLLLSGFLATALLLSGLLAGF